MKITESKEKFFKKSYWTEAKFVLQDIGKKTCWGHIVHCETGKILSLVSVFSIEEDDWIELSEAQEFIDSIKVKND